MATFRRIVEGLLPWYDPEHEQARHQRLEREARTGRRLARSVDAYGRIDIHH